MISRPVVLAVAGLAVASSALLSTTRSDGFPHEEHAGLFPTCLGCHRGISEGDADAYYSVEVADCARCHDGQRVEPVDWEGPSSTASNLVFTHLTHGEAVESAGDEPLVCAVCHGPVEPGRPRMEIGRAQPETCLGCHAPEAPEHLAAGAGCGACHASLAEAPDLEVDRVAQFPRPPSHASESFVLEHGGVEVDLEACSVCHARESCTRCHLNAPNVPAIVSLAEDPRIESIVRDSAGEWPEPATHEVIDWEFSHGTVAQSEDASCANCHTQTSCRSCHGEVRIAAVEALPSAEPDGPSGAVVRATRPPGHLPDFGIRHGAAVAADMPRCSSCHVEEQCAVCHERSANEGGARSLEAERGAPDVGLYAHVEQAVTPLPPEPRPGYHPDDFVMRHGAEAFGIQTNCADCHSTEVFCRDCHDSMSMAVGVADGAGGAFHDARPGWFFEHGIAARQGMESCASCHQQTSCLRCHSAKAGLRINPHGPGFDPSRQASRSTMACGVCHTAGQIPPP